MPLFKLDFLRRGHIGDIMKNELEQKGPLGFAKSVLRMRGMMEDPALAARYRAWEKLPEGTLGRSLVDFYKQHGFTVPGERGGFPEAGLYHDFCHLLGGYSTEPDGEIQVASFICGLQARAVVLRRAVRRADLQRRRQHAADGRRLRDGGRARQARHGRAHAGAIRVDRFLLAALQRRGRTPRTSPGRRTIRCAIDAVRLDRRRYVN